MSENVTQETQAPKQIIPNFDNKVDLKEFKFHFKKDKELGNKRESIELKLAVPSVEGIVSILEKGGKELELLLSACNDVVVGYARSILNDNESMTAATFPTDQCTWEVIANLPETEKRGRGIAKETWEEFAEDYVTVMPGITGKTKEQVALAAKLFVTKFNSVKTNKPVLQVLQQQLAVYANNAPQAEQFAECIKFLDEKATALINADPAAMLVNL